MRDEKDKGDKGDKVDFPPSLLSPSPSPFQEPPPKTSMLAKTQIGEPCPTQIAWFGSPLPQKGVPYIFQVEEFPTLIKLCQNSGVVAR